jgi:hypothetical protein
MTSEPSPQARRLPPAGFSRERAARRTRPCVQITCDYKWPIIRTCPHRNRRAACQHQRRRPLRKRMAMGLSEWFAERRYKKRVLNTVQETASRLFQTSTVVVSTGTRYEEWYSSWDEGPPPTESSTPPDLSAFVERCVTLLYTAKADATAIPGLLEAVVQSLPPVEWSSRFYKTVVTFTGEGCDVTTSEESYTNYCGPDLDRFLV